MMAMAPRYPKAGAVAWPETWWTRYKAMTTMPLARMAATFVVNSKSAARDWRGAPDSRVRPTTASGATKEMAKAPLARTCSAMGTLVPGLPGGPGRTMKTQRTGTGLGLSSDVARQCEDGRVRAWFLSRRRGSGRGLALLRARPLRCA